MNTLNAYSVMDVKSKLFARPHFQQTDGVAIRSFSQACEDDSTELNKYPEDFSLYHVGEFDIETGVLKPLERPKQICNASEFVQKQ